MRCDDDERRALPHHAAQPRQDLLFGVGVHRRQRIVQDQDARVEHHRAGERRALLLPARQRDAALADERVVALRESPRRPCRAARPPPRRATRASSALGTVRQRRRRTRCSRRCVSENRNGSCGTKPIAPRSVASGISRTSTPSRNTVPGGGSCSRGSRLISVDLPEPVAPTNAAVCPASIVQRHVVEHRRARCRDTRTSGRGSRCAPRMSSAPARGRDTGVVDVRDRVEHLEHPLPRRHAALQDVGDPAERDHRPAQHHQVGVEGDELAERDPAADDLAAARATARAASRSRERASCSDRTAPCSRISTRLRRTYSSLACAEPLELVRLPARRRGRRGRRPAPPARRR